MYTSIMNRVEIHRFTFEAQYLGVAEKKVSDLLREMQGRKSHMAIVLDEFDGVEGCVTLEDLVEDLVGG